MRDPVDLDDVSAAGGKAPAAVPTPAERENREVVYDWNLATDEIVWGPDLAAVLEMSDIAVLSTGLGYAEHLAAESPSSRYEAIIAGGHDAGNGVPFKVIYGLVPAKRSKAPPIWIEDCGRWFADAADRPGRVHGIIRDVTKRYESERRLAAATQRDEATGAYTRAFFVDHVMRQLSFAARKTSTFALMLIGLGVEDASGDALAAVAVARLQPEMRSHEILARYGAGKLATLLECCNEEQAAAAAARFLDVLAGKAGATPIHARVGAVIAPCHGRTSQALLQFAEEALDAARQPQSPPFVRYDPKQTRLKAHPVLQASDEILSALNDGRVALALQPIVDARTRAVAFYEGLVRITQVNGATLMPHAMVPVAEKEGLVPLLDRRVIELAFALLTADRKLVLSINASVASLQDAAWLESLRTGCRMRPDAARRLTVELTETYAIADIAATRRILEAIKPHGVKIAIDDFGSGHSSFRNLRDLPIDYLKIDGAFAQNLVNSSDDRFFIRTLIDLARNLQIPTVAEWVEDEETATILGEWGVTYLQGHLFGKAELVPVAPPRSRSAARAAS